MDMPLKDSRVECDFWLMKRSPEGNRSSKSMLSMPAHEAFLRSADVRRLYSELKVPILACMSIISSSPPAPISSQILVISEVCLLSPDRFP